MRERVRKRGREREREREIILFILVQAVVAKIMTENENLKIILPQAAKQKFAQKEATSKLMKKITF